MSRMTAGDIAPQHLSICYFSYPERYPPELINALLPRIRAVAARSMPLKVQVQGLEGGWERGWELPAIMWHIVDFGETRGFHDAIREELKNSIKHFNEEDVFEPHIGIALAHEDTVELRRIVEGSRNDAVFTLTLKALQIFYPDGPQEIFRHGH